MSDWYLAQNGQQRGPFTADQIAAMARDGSLTDQVYLAGPGLASWTVASQVPLVQQARSGAAPMGQAMGAPMGQAMGAPMGQAMGAPMGQAMGAPMGQAMGAPMGQPMGVPMGAPAMAGGAVAAAHGGAKGNWVQERLKGLGAVGLGLLIVILNVVTIVTSESFYPKSVIVAFAALFYGGWVVVFGDEYDDDTMELVRWKQIGMYGAGGLGLLLGIVVSIAIAD